MAQRHRLNVKILRDLVRGSEHSMNMCLVYNEETESLIVLPVEEIAEPDDIIITTQEIYTILNEEQAWEMSMPLKFTDAQLEQVLAYRAGPNPF